MKPDNGRSALPDLERRLRLKESLLDAHINASCEGVIAISAEGDVWHVNRRFRQMWGIPPAEVVPRCDAEVWPRILKQLREPKSFLHTVSTLTSDPLRVCEWQVPTRAGRTIECFTAPIADEHGNVAGRIWNFRDVTEKQRLQEELHRTRRLASVGQFSCGIAHDFRNLLVAVAGLSQMASSDLDEADDGQQHLREILRAAQYGRSLVDHLLAFGKGQPSGQQLLSIGALLQDTLVLLRVVSRGSIDLHTQVREDLPLVVADAVGIQQVLINLVMNAVQAIDRSDGRIEIRVAPHQRADRADASGSASEERSFVRLTVTDNGIGMAPGVIERAFEPFFSCAPGNPGLGLAIVREIVGGHGGFISVESCVGTGTTFHIDFPVALTAPRPGAQQTQIA